jgi:hypothetical protein
MVKVLWLGHRALMRSRLTVCNRADQATNHTARHHAAQAASKAIQTYAKETELGAIGTLRLRGSHPLTPSPRVSTLRKTRAPCRRLWAGTIASVTRDTLADHSVPQRRDLAINVCAVNGIVKTRIATSHRGVPVSDHCLGHVQSLGDDGSSGGDVGVEVSDTQKEVILNQRVDGSRRGDLPAGVRSKFVALGRPRTEA